MGIDRRILAVRIAAAAAGISAAVLIGSMYPKQSYTEPDGDTAGFKTSAVSAVSADSKAVTAGTVKGTAEKKGSEQSEDLEFIEYRKAVIGEYEMVSQSTAPVVVYSSAKSPEETGNDEIDPEKFVVTLPDDNTEVYDVRTEKMNYTKTRSVADEYFTVYDLLTDSIVTMNAHDMLCLMVYNEIGATWDEDCIKALVVAAYSHLRYNDAIGRIVTIALRHGYPEKIERCVSEVEGQAVYYRGGIINATYTASTVGYSADSAVIFNMDFPYLKPVVSEYDHLDPNYGNETDFTEDEVREALEKKLGITLSDNVQDWFTVESMHAGKYVRMLSIDGGKARIAGTDMRWLFKLKSSAFEISYDDGIFTFTTYGYGHGVGLSAWGMKYYGDDGWSYDQILRHYFVGTTISVSDECENAVERGKSLSLENGGVVAVDPDVTFDEDDYYFQIPVQESETADTGAADKTPETESSVTETESSKAEQAAVKPEQPEETKSAADDTQPADETAQPEPEPESVPEPEPEPEPSGDTASADTQDTQAADAAE